MRGLDAQSSLQQKEHGEQKSRVVVMLGARMIDPKGTGEWQFPLVSPDQMNSGTSLPGEVSGGWSRMRAIQSEYQKAQREDPASKTFVLVTSGKDSSGVSRSKEAAERLVGNYGLPPDSVASIAGIGTTLDNAAAAGEYLREHRETLGDVRNIDLVTNDYHMLRAWIMFSRGILKSTTDKTLKVSLEDKQKIKILLDEGLPDSDAWSEERITETRKKVMEVLIPYFSDSKIRVDPVIVEETLEHDTFAKERYAGMLRNNKWVKETIQFEYQGIKDLLDGKYKGK